MILNKERIDLYTKSGFKIIDAREGAQYNEIFDSAWAAEEFLKNKIKEFNCNENYENKFIRIKPVYEKI